MRGFKRDLTSVAGFLIVAFAVPHLFTNDYYIDVLTLAWIHAIIAVGLNLLMGYAGQISLGHAAFYGLAAYTSATVTTTLSLPILVGLTAGIALVGVVAFLIGVPTLKLKGHYLAMATLGFGIIVYIFLNETIGLTGGPSGLTGIPRLALFGYTFETDLSYYYLVAIVLAGVILLSLNLIHSKFGRALQAVHTSEVASVVIGIDVAKYKIFVFVLSALFAALAGVLYAHLITFVAPSSFGFNFSIELITMVVLGGLASVWGAVTGALFLTVLPEFLRTFENVEILLYGAILIICMLLLPSGLAGAVIKLVKTVKGERGGNAGI